MATIKAKDQVTVLDITDAYSVILTSEAYTFVGNTSGAPSGLSCSTQVVAYQGSTSVQKITVTVTPPSGITANIAGNGGSSPTITFTTTSTITASCEATIAVKIDDTTINKKFSFSVAKEGSAGKGIKSTSITYQAGSYGTTAPTGTWVSSPPKTTAAAPYMWTKTVITYTDNSTSTSYSVGSTPEGIQVGGTNLYTGTKDFTGSAWANYDKNAVYHIVDSKYKDFTVIKKSSLWGGIYQPINTINGDIYTLSFYAKGDLGTKFTLVASNKAVTEGVYNGISVIGGNFTVNNDWWGVSDDATEWKRYWAAIKISVDGAILSARPELSTNSVGTVYICGLKLEKGNTPTDWTPAPEDAIASVDVEYYLSTSATSLGGGSWSTMAPTWVNGKYMWSRTVKTDGSGNKTYSPSQNGVCIAGAKGDTGSTGAAGKGVTSIVEQYYKSTSAASLAGGSWSTTYPGWENGKYIWTRSAITYTDSTTPVYTTAICVTGEKGDTGATGTSVTKTTRYYKLQDSSAAVPSTPTTNPPSGWTTTEPTYESGKILYFVDITTFSNGSVSYSAVSVSSSYKAASDVKDQVDEIKMNYRFDDDGQYIGKEDSDTTLRLANDKMQFIQAGTPAAEVNSKGLVAEQSTIDVLRIGDYFMSVYSDGYLHIT